MFNRVLMESVESEGVLMINSMETQPTPAIHAEGARRSGLPTEIPLSYGQRALWFLQQLVPQSPAYNIVNVVRIPQAIDIAALQRAFHQLVARHPMLQAAFITRDNEPVQLLVPQREIVVQVEDATNWSPAQLNERLALEVYRPFDLEHEPLVRMILCSCSPQDHLCIFVMHHIVTDLWSMAVIIHEINLLYQAEKTGHSPKLKALTAHYTDYIRWQHELLASPEGEKLRAYWQQQLAGDLPPLNLPTDCPRPPVPSYRGATQTIRIGAELTRDLRVLAKAHNATLFMTVLAAFQVLLYRYSGQETFMVGSPRAGRRRQWAGLIGYFVNPVVLRADLAAHLPFATLIGQVRQTVLQAFEHADYPFPLLVRQVQPERELSRSPIFQVMFSWQKTTQLVSGGNITSFALNETGGRLGSEELPLESVMLEQRVAPFDLTLFMGESRDELVAAMEYSTDLFDASTIQRMLQHFQQVLRSIIANPEQPVANLPLLSHAERHQLLIEWNATATPYPRDICLHQLITEQAHRTPAAPAVVFEGQTLTYADLDQRANQLAHYLLSWGVVPDTPIALCVERSLEMIVGLLGILKAGAAYLPLDPFYPAERLAFMLQDSQAPILLTQQHIDHHPWTSSASRDDGRPLSIISLDRDWATIAQQPDSNPDSAVTAEHLAYIIYTSGSTGQPKGAMISHRAIVNRLLWMQEAYHLTPADRVLQKTPFTFDVSVWEFFWPLLTGACLVVARPEGHKDTPYLVDMIAEAGITTLHFVPPMLQVFLAEADISRCHSLRRVICSGEALPFELQQRFYTLLDAELHNLYGPTEAAVDVSFWACERLPSRASVPIGRPVANTQLYVLDAQLQPVPIGVAGELHIGGVQLARGYLNRPELTAEKFIRSPFSPEPGARLYKTGDLARFLPDGAIEYLGRLDHQVKVRGFRIELGEIEALLAQHPAVREVVVLAREDRPGHKRLVAYLVPDQQPAPGAREFRQFVQERLPEYMVPSAFVTLDALPLTPNGKVNRRALPRPEDDRNGQEELYLAPRTPVEITLAAIWSQVLGVERIGVHDNFFERGGDSILSIQLVGRANRAGLRLTPQQIFQFPTLGQMAAVAGSAPAIPAAQGLVTGEVPLTPIQHWFFEQNLPEPDHWNQAVLLEVSQPLVRALIEETMRHLLTQHDVLRMQFTRTAECWQQINTTRIDPAALVTWIDLTALPVAEQDAAMAASSAAMQGSLNLANGPLVRLGYFDLGSVRPGRILFIIHHLVVDGVSWRILLEDFSSIYQQLSQSQAPQLPLKTSAFQQWAEHLVAYAETVAARSELAYWLRLREAAVTTLPLDHPGGDNSEASARQVRVVLDLDATRMLLQEVPAVYNTSINDLLLTALAQTLADWTGQQTVLVDVEGHGRADLFADIDLSRTVGWFTTIYPVALTLPDAANPGALLVALKEQLHQVPRHGIGYGLLRYLSPPEIADQMRMLPAAAIRFNYLGQFDQSYAEASLFAPVTGNYGALHSPRGLRRYLLELDALVEGGMLQVAWTYSQAQFERDTIEQVAEAFIQSLRHILAHCARQATRVYTPSDFPLAGLNQNQLDTISAKIQKTVKRGSR